MKDVTAPRGFQSYFRFSWGYWVREIWRVMWGFQSYFRFSCTWVRAQRMPPQPP